MFFSLLKGPWEHVEVRRECNVPEDVFEAVSLPEAEDSYASLHCGCSCHQGEHAIFKSFTQHCVSCGLKVCILFSLFFWVSNKFP